MLSPDGVRYEILPEHTALAESKGYTYESDTATVIDKTTGLPFEVARESKDAQVGVRDESPEEFRAREAETKLQREHGGIGERIIGGVESIAGTATFGATDIALGAIGGEEYKEAKAGRRAASPTQTMLTDITGLVVPTLLTGGAGGVGALARATPTALATKAGLAVGKKSLVKGMALEGTLQGIGQTVREEALSTDPFEMETFFSNLGDDVLWGAATGGLVGGAGKATKVFAKAANKGVIRAKGLIDDVAAKAKAGKGAIADDLASMDKAGLRQAKVSAQEEMGGEVAAGMRASYDDQTDSMFKALTASDKKVLADTRGARGWIRKHLDDPKGIAENPNVLAKSLRKEEELLRKVIDDQTGALAKLRKADDAVLAKIEKRLASGTDESLLLKGDEGDLFGNVRGIQVSRKSGVKVGRDKVAKFLEEARAGSAAEMRSGALAQLPDALETNLSLQAQISGIKKGTAPRLMEIQAAQDALGTGVKKGSVQKMAEAGIQGMATGALAPIAGFTAGGAIAGKISDTLGDLIFRRGTKAAAEGAKRTSAALDILMDTGAKVGKLAPPLATKVLAGTSYGQDLALGKKDNKPKSLVEHYKARQQEIQSKVTMGPTGPTMRPQARQELASRLEGVRAVSPKLADHIETVANRKISFLSSKLPKRPDFMRHATGPDSYQPSNMAMRTFARYMAAVEDPGAVEERLADGTLSPEDAEAYRTVYPERYRAMQEAIIQRLPELRETLPYAKRLSLSIFSGVAVDPALDPRVFKQYQAQFTHEEGSNGGTQAPVPSPQFGSVKAPEPTTAQERAG
jgi:hypothetical protein